MKVLADLNNKVVVFVNKNAIFSNKNGAGYGNGFLLHGLLTELAGA